MIRPILHTALGVFAGIASATTTLAAEFELSWNTIDGGGAMSSSGGAFELSGTIGQPDAGHSAGGEFALSGGFWPSVANSTDVAGDCDGDGDADQLDFACYVDCVTGPDAGVPTDCETFDLDADNDVDLIDWSLFQTAFTGG